MVKNDYRRSLIMLRTHEQGYSGHVRLERRTLIGSMFFVINAPAGGELCASLIRRNAAGTYFAARIGELRRDGRGQATLAYSFDPRNIDGYTLEDYILIAIVHRTRENCDVVLSGNVNGSVEVSWNSVRAAACMACEPPRVPACDLCPPPPQPRPDVPAAPGEGPAGLPTPDLPIFDGPAAPGEGPADLPTPIVPGPEDPANPLEPPEGFPTPIVPGPPDPANPFEPPEGPQTPALPGVESPADLAAFAQISDNPAADSLDADLSVPWPGVSEQLRPLFLTQPARELMLGDGHTYVRAPMPEGSGYSHVDVGVRMKNGVPDSITYALPSRYSPEPPPGLEDYLWQGGASEGWWMLRTDPATGEKLH